MPGMRALLAAALVPCIAPDAFIPQEPATAAPPAALTLYDLAGTWSGTARHDGETSPVALELEPGDDGKVLVKWSAAAVHVEHAPLGRTTPKVEGHEVPLGPCRLTCVRGAGTLGGALQEGRAPRYRVPCLLTRGEKLDWRPRAEAAGAGATPAWTFDAGAPLWPGTSFASGVVYAGAEDGRLHALDGATGKARWSFPTGGPIRTRAVADRGTVYFQSDDGFLYALHAASGRLRFKVRAVEKPVERLRPSDSKSRFDRFGSDVTEAGGRLYLGTHDGRVLCLDPARGKTVWQFASGDSVLAAPAVDSGRAYFGSYDGNVYALDAASGRLLWKRDTGKPVVSTPAVAGDRVVVGSRSYDLFGLDARTGEVAWRRYVWFSWVESSPVVRDGIAYVGSSDAAALFA